MSTPSQRLLGFVASVISGVLLFVAGEPLGIGPLAWAALVPLMIAVLSERKLVWSWLYGLAFGIAYFGVHLSWIFLFGWMAWTALVAFLALYLSAAAFLARVLRRFPLAPALIAGAWAGIELARDRWPVGGYPWGTVGTTQAAVPGVRFLAGVVGVYGLTFLIVFFAALVADRVVSGGWAWGSIAVVGGAILLFTAVDALRYGSPPPGRPERMLVVQGGVPRPPRPDQRNAILDAHITTTRRAFERGEIPDVVVWPEDAIGIGVRSGAEREVAALARELGTPLLVGRSVTEDGGFLNTVEHYTAQGERAGRYVKRHPVPFGEYVPFGFLRNFVSTLEAEVPYDLRPGRDAVVFDVDGTKIAAPICFESVFPRDIRDFTRRGAEIIIISTNNASFEHSYASQQHLAHARIRALETRQWVVQAALAGISAVTAPDGRVEHATALFEQASFSTTVRARPAHSLYERVGDLFPALFALGTLGALALFGVTLVSGRTRREILSE